MAINRNALIRYRTIDACLRNRYRHWTLEDLIDACSDALYELEGIDRGVSRRTVQTDIELMRSGKLGYEAPIVVVERKYYAYSDSTFTITNIPITPQDMSVLSEAAALLKQFTGLKMSDDLMEMIAKLEDKVYAQRTRSHPLVEFERNDNLRGLHWIEGVRRCMMDRKCFQVTYKSFRARSASTYPFSPYLLKEYRNRWFVLGRAHVKQAVLLTLALDRIENIEEMEQGAELFIPNTDVDLDTFFKDVVGVTRSLKCRPVHVVFKADRKNAPYLKTKPMHSSQRIIEEDEDGTTFSIDVILNFELEREFLGFGSSVEVLAPRVLRNRIRRVVTEASLMYGE